MMLFKKVWGEGDRIRMKAMDEDFTKRAKAAPIEAEKELDDELRGLVRSAVWFWEPKSDRNLYGHPGFEELIKEFQALVDKALVAELEKLRDEMKMHTVPESPHLITRSYLNNTITFRISQLNGATDE